MHNMNIKMNMLAEIEGETSVYLPGCVALPSRVVRRYVCMLSLFCSIHIGNTNAMPYRPRVYEPRGKGRGHRGVSVSSGTKRRGLRVRV